MPTPPHELYPLIFGSIGEGVFTVDEGFRITSFNAAAERLTGITSEQALGMKCHEVFKADICQTGCALRKSVETGQECRNVEVTILNADMEEVPVSVSTAVLRDERGAVLGGVEIMRDISEVDTLRRELEGRTVFQDIVGASKPMQEVFRILPDVARSDVPALIQGPSGTGKELVARAIHRLSARADAPFLQVNCGALPDSLLESELFGYLKGAFTDARHDHRGRFVAADGGTLLLDEIGDTSPAFQVKLLRVLEDGEVQPLGSSSTRKVDVRLISATNKDLDAMVRAGTFREDLFYRLRVVLLDLPPLRERREDIPLLLDHLLLRICLKRGRSVDGISSAALDRLYAYDYPGNVRELENILERALVLCHGPRIGKEHLPPEVLSPSRSPLTSSPGARLKPSTRVILSAAVDDEAEGALPVEGEKLLAALNANGWNRQRTARALGISRSTLWRRMKEYGIIP